MLVAKRDPFHPGAHDTSHSDFNIGLQPQRAPGLMRTMSALQMFGTLLAIPLGIGSAYTMYRANFSPETTCQSLRSNIVSMLDKGVDARTRHILVRHDVEAFEKSCASVDADAAAAFKTLLASDRAAAARRAEARAPDAKAKETARASVPRSGAAAAKTAVEQKPLQRDVRSDAAWLAAVRGALTPNEVEPAKPAERDAVLPITAEPARQVVRPVAREASPKPELGAALPPAPPAIAVPVAPPPAAVATVPAPAQDPDHPVPPASIPTAPPLELLAQQREPSHLGAFIAHIPLIGPMIGSK